MELLQMKPTFWGSFYFNVLFFFFKKPGEKFQWQRHHFSESFQLRGLEAQPLN